MDRRAVLRALGVGIVGVSGCTSTQSPESEPLASETTASETTDPDTETTAREATTTPDSETFGSDPETTAEPPRTTTSGCSPSAVSENRLHVHSDYGLGIVDADTERPAVAVVGENWRSKLRTEEMSDEDETFVTETDFERSVVLVVQYTESGSANELRITDYAFDGDTLHAQLCVVARGGPNDAPTTNLFARLDHAGPVSSTVEARIERPMETVTVSSQ